jgi:hypothetical protein
MSCRKPMVRLKDHTGRNLIKLPPTYAHVKKHMSEYMNESIDGIVEVTRTRRGEWGEWFERWERNEDSGRLIITKQTWL